MEPSQSIPGRTGRSGGTGALRHSLRGASTGASVHVTVNHPRAVSGVLNFRESSRFGCWNVRTLNYTGATYMLARNMSKYKLHICGLSEVRWVDSGMIPIAQGHTLLFSGRKDGKHRQGVGLALSRKARTALKSFTPVNSRIITARFAASHGFCTVVQVYAPTNDSQEAQKNAFYEQLQSTLDNIPKQDVLVLMGDFNAKIGSDHRHWHGVLGKHGIGGVSDNGLRLLEFCALNGLVITNSFFQHKAIHKYTWYSNTGRTRNAIDHIIVRSKSLSSVQDTRVFRGADISSDHRLVASSLKLRFKRACPKGNIEPRFNSDLLADDCVLDHFQSVVGGRFHALLNDMEVDTNDSEDVTVESEWSRFSKEVAASALEVLGEQKSYKSWPWVTESTEQLVEEKRKAFILSVNHPSPESHQRYRSLVNKTKASVRVDKNRWWREQAEDIQNDANQHRSKSFYHKLRRLTKGFSCADLGHIKDKDGNLLEDEIAKLERWAEHFHGVLNVDGCVDESLLNSLPNPASNLPVAINEPDIGEVLAAIKMLNDSAPGLDRITAKILKAGGIVIAQWLLRVILLVWRSGKCPADWKRAAIIALFKKGDKAVCDNYRGISLLSVPGKVYTILLYNRLKSSIDKALSEQQCGFRPGRGCVDQIFSIRRIMEMAGEFHMPLHVYFVDLKKAYDSVDRAALWKILESMGVPHKIVDLLKDLHDGTAACVKGFGRLSEWFSIKSGVRQGCIIAPLLFNTFIDFLLRETLKDLPDDCGFEIHFKIDGCLERPTSKRALGTHTRQLISHLMYADDMALLASNPEVLERMLLKLEEITQAWGMCISVPKTKIMTLSRPNGTQPLWPICIRGEHVESVDEFAYLGSQVSCDGSLHVEINNRIARAGKAFHMLLRCFRSKSIERRTKVAVYKACVLPCLLYGSETWPVLKEHIQRLHVFHMNCLRRICRLSRRRVNNQSVLEQCRCDSMDMMLHAARLRWLGHVARMAEHRVPKRLLFSHVSGRRSRGKPRKRWTDVVKDDLKRRGHTNNWYRSCQDRAFWRSMLSRGRN